MKVKKNISLWREKQQREQIYQEAKIKKCETKKSCLEKGKYKKNIFKHKMLLILQFLECGLDKKGFIQQRFRIKGVWSDHN